MVCVWVVQTVDVVHSVLALLVGVTETTGFLVEEAVSDETGQTVV